MILLEECEQIQLKEPDHKNKELPVLIDSIYFDFLTRNIHLIESIDVK